MTGSGRELKKCKRIAVMGGTFDPIHYGHLVAAEEVRCEFSTDLVVFIPSGIPPHKKHSHVTEPEERYMMTVLATMNNPCFAVSRMEIDRQGETYTIDTIRQLREQAHPDAEIFFITGADAVHQILTWRNAAELLQLCSFVAVTRPGYNNGDLQREVMRLKARFASRLYFLEVPALAISSTDIRNRVSASRPISYLVPESVERYITKQGLYTDSIEEFIREVVRSKLSERRYNHTMGVLEEALNLAQEYGESREKTYIAALLHDYAKEIPPQEKLEMCERLGIVVDGVMKRHPELTHSFLGAALAKTEFGIDDKRVLNAITYHTTGRKRMNRLEKILFVADLTEPSREPYQGISEVRRLAKINLDRAVLEGLRVKLQFTKKSNKQVHPLSIEAIKYYTKSNKKIDKEEAYDGSGKNSV